MRKEIDINSDVGERQEALLDGSEEQLIQHITSANIACSGHAGTEETMTQVVQLCIKHSVGIGAHPGYPDRGNFGRTEMDLSPQEIEQSVYEQVQALNKIARSLGTRIRHVKPHGALYNSAVTNDTIARAIAGGVGKVDNSLILIGLAGSRMVEVWKSEGFKLAGETFADRRYESDGTLRSRKFPDALNTDPMEAAEQAVKIARDGVISAVDGTILHVEAETICIHSDTPNSAAIAREVRRRLKEAGIVVKALSIE